MRDLKQLLSTGCFFLCLGGWVCDGRAVGADPAVASREAALNAAVSQAAIPGSATDNTPTTNPTITPQPMQAPIPPQTPVPEPGAVSAPTTTEPAPDASKSEGASTNLNSAVVNVGVDGMVEQFNAQDLDINTALHFLSLQSKRNIIASKDVKGTVTANLYNVTFTEALDSLLKPNGFDYVEKGNFIYVYTTKELEDIRKRDRKTVNHIFQLHYVNAADASVLIKPMLSSNGVLALTPPTLMGLSSGTADTGGMNYSTDDTLVINDYPENINDIAKALLEIDERPKQVLIESTILNAQLSDNNALGIDVVSLSGLDFSNILSAVGSAAGGSSNGTSSSVSTPGALSGVLLPGGGSNPQVNAGTNFANQVPAGGLSVGFLTNHVSAYVRALESVTDTTVVANPKILTLNKQHGEVHIGGQLGYLTTTTSTTTTQQTVQFIDTGTKLIFRPFIGNDGYIRMEIHPENSTGAIDAHGVPQTETTEVTSNVMVKDGRTIVIGGLFSESTTASRGQVPILGNIPILGIPFRQTNDSTVRVETIVLITPHIINDDTSLYEESEKASEDVTRQMLGNRAGLQPWGRDRIAQLWYAKARDQLEKGNKDKALMYVDWALNTQPRFIEALKLREDLTNKKVEEATQSSLEPFVRNVLADDAAITPDMTGGSGHVNPVPATQPVEVK
jgi:type IV pilus assembly protein PilQ